MGDFKFGGSDVDNIMFGTEQVDKIYMGTEQVWSKTVAGLDDTGEFRSGSTQGYTISGWHISGGVGLYSNTLTGNISKTLNFTSGSFRVDILYQQGNSYGGINGFDIRINGSLSGASVSATVSPGVDTLLTTSVGVVTPGLRSISISNSGGGGDPSLYVRKVRVYSI